MSLPRVSGTTCTPRRKRFQPTQCSRSSAPMRSRASSGCCGDGGGVGPDSRTGVVEPGWRRERCGGAERHALGIEAWTQPAPLGTTRDRTASASRMPVDDIVSTTQRPTASRSSSRATSPWRGAGELLAQPSHHSCSSRTHRRAAHGLEPLGLRTRAQRLPSGPSRCWHGGRVRRAAWRTTPVFGLAAVAISPAAARRNSIGASGDQAGTHHPDARARTRRARPWRPRSPRTPARGACRLRWPARTRGRRPPGGRPWELSQTPRCALRGAPDRTVLAAGEVSLRMADEVSASSHVSDAPRIS